MRQYSRSDLSDESDANVGGHAYDHSMAFVMHWFGGFHRADGDDFTNDDAADMVDHLHEGRGNQYKGHNQSRRNRGLLSRFDRDGDGTVEMEDLVEADVDMAGVSKEEFDKTYFPWFIIIQCSVAVLFWLVFVVRNCSDPIESYYQCPNGWYSSMAGLVNIWPETTLQFHDYSCHSYRWQLWRLFTYQFTHANLPHISMNILLTMIIGLPLDVKQGAFRMFFMFNVGVFSGGLAVALFDCHAVVVGMSGGCYALIGMKFSDLALNWGQKPYRKAEVCMLVSFILIDSLYAFVFEKANSATSSLVCHSGGMLGGFLVGLLVEHDYKAEFSDFIWKIIAAVCWVAILICAWVRIASFGDSPMQNLIDSDPAWCYLRQVSDLPTFNDQLWHCVYCYSDACMSQWNSFRYVANVTHLQCTRYTTLAMREGAA